MNRVYILSILAAVLVCAPLKGQITGGVIIDTTAILPALNDDMEDNLSLRNTLDNMFSELEKDRVPTGLLRDFAVELVDISKFDGTLADSTLLNARTFEYILRSIRSSAVGQKPFSTVSSIMADMKSHQTRAVIPFGVAAFRYNYIVSNAVSSGLIGYNQATGKVYDQYSLQIIDPGLVQPGDMFEPEEPYQPGPENPDPHIIDPIIEPNPDPVIPGEIDTWINPYAEAYVYAASPSVDIITSPYVTFSFSDDWIFSNLDIVSLEFDSGLGQGYQTISLSGEDFSVYYGGQGGVFETKTRMTLANGTVLQSHNAIYVYSIDALVVPMNEPDDTVQFTSRVTLEGHTPHATASVKYSSSHPYGQIVTPLIIAEGFEPFSLNPDNPSTSFYHNKGYRSLYNIANELLSADEYDIIYVDWEDSGAPIEANADILIQVIQWVNSEKNGTEPNVVLGYSMGGLIARYALRKMEIDGIPHQTNTYVSYDTPHLGAHIPLGYMYLARDIKNGEFTKPLPAIVLSVGRFLMSFLPDAIVSKTEDAFTIIDAPSVKQMLYYYVDSNGVVDNTRHEAFRQTISSMGFPQGQNNVPMKVLGVSNGGAQALSLPDELLSFSASLFVGSIGNFLDALSQVSDFSSFLNALTAFLFPRLTTYTLETTISPFISNNQEVYYSKMILHKNFLWWFDHDEVVYETHKTGNSNGAPLYETLPSSYYVIDGDYANTPPHSFGETVDTLFVSFDYQMYSHIPFIPVASSLCSDSYNVDFFSNPLSKLSHTPFNSFYIESSPSSHIAEMDSAYVWISRASKFSILNKNASTNNIVTGDTLYVEPNYYTGGLWSSSLPSIASINTSGRVTVPGRGTVDINYSGIDSNGRPYRFTRKFFAGGRPMFNLSYYKWPIPIDNDRTYRYSVGASYVGNSGEGLTPTRLFWAESETSPCIVHIDTVIQPTFNWIESSLFGYSTPIAWNSHKYVSFKAEYEGYSTGIYTIYCKNPDYDVTGLIDDSGGLVPLDLPLEEDDGEVTLTYILDEDTFVFNGRPDSYTVLSFFLENNNFVSQVQEVAPWGDKDFIIIPFQVVNNDSSEVFDSCVKLFYQSNNNEE